MSRELQGQTKHTDGFAKVALDHKLGWEAVVGSRSSMRLLLQTVAERSSGGMDIDEGHTMIVRENVGFCPLVRMSRACGGFASEMCWGLLPDHKRELFAVTMWGLGYCDRCVWSLGPSCLGAATQLNVHVFVCLLGFAGCYSITALRQAH